jgi:hypothetical protein
MNAPIVDTTIGTNHITLSFEVTSGPSGGGDCRNTRAKAVPKQIEESMLFNIEMVGLGAIILRGIGDCFVMLELLREIKGRRRSFM